MRDNRHPRRSWRRFDPDFDFKNEEDSSPYWRWHNHRRPHRHYWPGSDATDPKRRFLYRRAGRFFVFFLLMVFGGMALVTYLVNRLMGGSSENILPTLLGGGAVVFGLLLIVVGVASKLFQRAVNPMANIMAASDSLAEGDFSVRVPEVSNGEFGRMEVAFNHMAEELERADQQRRNLTADVAHELRTPLHIIQGNLEGILDGVYEPTPEHLNATLEETHLLARLVSDLRTLSLAEAGQLHLELQLVNAAELLEDVHTSFSGPCEAAGIDLTLNIDGERDALAVQGDIDRLDQVLGNLVSNALRHTPSGGAIHLRAVSSEGSVRIQVQDTGEGISPDDLPYIFDRFYRADRARTHAGGAGSGLGLAIARQLIHSHGGAIDAESELGAGTTFTIELPK